MPRACCVYFRAARVITGVALVTAAGTEVAAEVTAVRFLTLSDAEIAGYVAGGEPIDRPELTPSRPRGSLDFPHTSKAATST